MLGFYKILFKLFIVMGRLGFLFGDRNNGVVIFVEKKKLVGDFIVGELSKLPKNCQFYFLDINLNLNDYVVFDNAKFKYGKICLAEKTVLDFEFLTFWFGIRKYTKLKQIFEEGRENLENDFLVKLIVKLYDYF